MRADFVKRALLVCVVLLLPVAGYAQEATITGTATDSTGAVLPGVTVVAVHQATGNQFEAVTDGRGIYRIPVRIGAYRITASLPGFTTVERSGVQLLVGQTATVSMQMAPSTIQETVTVTAEAPLLDVTTSDVGGNIDPLQMQELPVQGRGWMTLALLAPGNRTTAISENPVQDRGDVREFQLNVDGQQVTQELGIGGQPRYSRDAIAEFQFISNRFDATQGRSMGVQVNVVTKSGTNAVSGGGGAYFRHDSFNAADPVLDIVLPYSNQQVSTYLGGPIRRDRLHFFGNYEYEREPTTYVWQTAWSRFNITREHKATRKIGGLRLDYQLSPQTRLMAKGHMAVEEPPLATGSLANHPATANRQDRKNEEALLQFTQVVSNRALNEIRVGYSSWRVAQTNLTNWSRHWQAPNGVTGGHPRIRFRGFSILGNSNAPRLRHQGVYSLRDDFSFSYTAAGRHDMKAGGEWLYRGEASKNRFLSGGLIDARGGPVPANIEALFPDPFNADTWNLAALSPITRTYEVGVGNFSQPIDQNKLGAWVQDDWRISSRLTLNLGVRYDLTTNAYSNDVGIPPWLEAGRPDDTNNVQPRVGFAYSLDDRTVLRGGAGLYFGDVLVTDSFWTLVSANIQQVRVNNDGRPDFAVNPFNGPLPTVEQALQAYCHIRNVSGCFFRNLSEIGPPEEYSDFSYSWQGSIGIARQIGDAMAIEIDYVSNRNRNEKIIQENLNLTFDPATGVNFPFSDRSRRPQPDWGTVSTVPHTGRSNYHGLQTAFTKRLRNRWQASASYLLSQLKNADGLPLSGLRQVTFAVAPDLGNEYTLAETDQRHRLVFNGIWQAGYGFQVSGLYFYGSGERLERIYDLDVRDLGVDGLTGSPRARPNGSIVPRNDFIRKPVHRVDVRLQQRIPLVGRTSIDGMLEVFNLFNRKNFGSYVTDESSPRFGEPTTTTNLAFTPRAMQLGFRLTF